MRNVGACLGIPARDEQRVGRGDLRLLRRGQRAADPCRRDLASRLARQPTPLDLASPGRALVTLVAFGIRPPVRCSA
jgi:hypothetical protein